MEMLSAVTAVVAHPMVHGALRGAFVAGGIDILAFRSWKRWDDAASYDWNVATWRWFQGAVLGALEAAVTSAVVGG